MRTRPAVLVLCLVALAGCGTTRDVTDQERTHVGRTPAVGHHSVGYHGISVDVPDTAQLAEVNLCGQGLPSSGSLVVPLFVDAPSSCPTATATSAPRPADVLTVVLAETGAGAGLEAGDLGLPDARRIEVAATGVTVTASGPAADVDAVLASARVTPTDDRGCVQRIDPSVALRNTSTVDGSLLAGPISRIVECEYAPTTSPDTSGDLSDPGPFWLIASAELGDAEVREVTTAMDDATPIDGRSPEGATPTPLLRMLVLGNDGNTRTLQVEPDTTPEIVTDGRRTVGVNAPDGSFPALPTPFTRF